MSNKLIKMVTCGIGLHRWDIGRSASGVEMPGKRRFRARIYKCERCGKKRKDKVYFG